MPLYDTVFYLVTGSLILAIGLFSFLRNSRSPVNRSLFIFALSDIFWMSSLYLGYYFIDPASPALSTFFIRLTFPFGLIMSLALWSIAYFYPRENFSYSKKFKYFFVGATILTSIISIFTSLVYEKEVIVNRLVAKLEKNLNKLIPSLISYPIFK